MVSTDGEGARQGLAAVCFTRAGIAPKLGQNGDGEGKADMSFRGSSHLLHSYDIVSPEPRRSAAEWGTDSVIIEAKC